MSPFVLMVFVFGMQGMAVTSMDMPSREVCSRAAVAAQGLSALGRGVIATCIDRREAQP